MSHRNLLGLHANPPHFPCLLETELGANCADPRSGSWFGRMAEQRPLTGYEPNSLLEISSEYTPINFNSVPTTTAASDVADFHDERQLTSPLFTQETKESANPFRTSVHQQKQQQAAASSQCQKSVANVECWELRETAAES